MQKLLILLTIPILLATGCKIQGPNEVSGEITKVTPKYIIIENSFKCYDPDKVKSAHVGSYVSCEVNKHEPLSDSDREYSTNQ